VGSIAIFNRRDGFFEDGVKMADRLRDTLDCDIRFADLADVDLLRRQISDSDILVNATSVGMEETSGQMVLPDTSFLHPDLVVCDLIYVPRETFLLKQAAKTGCRTISGMGMQLFQAVPAFKLWTGEEMDVAVARRALFGQEA
jgi:shikimate dehydrogenase